MSTDGTSLTTASKDSRYEGRGDVASVYGVERERAGLELKNKAVLQSRKE